MEKLICDCESISSGLPLLYPEVLLTSPCCPAEPVSFCTHFVSKDIDGAVALTTLNANSTEIERFINQFFIKSYLNLRELRSVKINSGTIGKFWFLRVLFAWLERGQQTRHTGIPKGQNKVTFKSDKMNRMKPNTDIILSLYRKYKVDTIHSNLIKCYTFICGQNKTHINCMKTKCFNLTKGF